MVERDPEKFLSGLIDAFRNRLETESSLKPQYLAFSAAMSAVPLRLSALDRLAAKFPEASINANTDLGKRQEQNQILFDFFTNALAAIESFCFGSYFVGEVLDPDSFVFGASVSSRLEQLGKINPKKTLESYTAFAQNSEFTERFGDCLDSNEYKLIGMMRNLLVHRIIPGRTIRLSTIGDFPHVIDLDQWYEGDMARIHGGSGLPEPKWTFELDAKCLVRQRDWIDNSIDRLACELTELAKARGLE